MPISNATLLAYVGVAGTIAGALIGSFSAATIETLNRRKQQRQALAAELARVGHNYLATLEQLAEALSKPESSALKPTRADLTAQHGTLIALQFQAWSLFESRPVRATFARLLSRAEVVADYIAAESATADDRRLATDWFKMGLKDLITECASAGGVPMHDRGGIRFIGFRTVTRADKRRLSFDDDAPPWQFDLTVDVSSRVPVDIEQLCRKIGEKLCSVRCPVHQRPVHIHFYGSFPNVEVHKIACCDDSAKRIDEIMTKAGWGRPSNG